MDEEQIRESIISKCRELNPKAPHARRQDLKIFMQEGYISMGAFLGIEVKIPRYVVIARPLLTSGTIIGNNKIDPYNLESRFVLISDDENNEEQLFTTSHEAGHLFHNLYTGKFINTTNRRQYFREDKFAERYAIAHFKILGKDIPPALVIDDCRKDILKTKEQLKEILLKELEYAKNSS